MDKYLVINAGSSSLKFSLYDMPNEKLICFGYVEKIGFNDSFWTINYYGGKISHNELINNHGDSVKIMIRELIDNNIINSLDDIKGIGHRVLHGGEYYNESVIIDDVVLDNISKLTKLGPLHHPGEIAGIKAMFEYLPNVKQVAVFDTAFHQSMPKYNYLYAVPYNWYKDYNVRKYGFHGTSHKYITNEVCKILNKDKVNLIICHVGSGASISCIKDSKCLNTTMGLTPLDGLVMGTRSGNIDPSIIKYIKNEAMLNIDDIDNYLNKKSGLLGICGKNDFRDVVKLYNEGDELAGIAYNMFMNSIIKYIAEYYFELEGNVDMIVFTAGVLENNVMLREDIINKISNTIGIYLDKNMNDNIGYGHELRMGIITTSDSKIPVMVIPTNEEIMIVRDSYNLINK